MQPNWKFTSKKSMLYKILKINYQVQVKIIEELSENHFAENAHIIIIGSYVGLKGRKGLAAYASGKGAIIGFALDAAKRLAAKNICVNVVLPGWLKSDMTAQINDDEFRKNISENLLGRGNNIKEIAEFIFNISKMQNISGQIFALDSRPLFL